MKKISAYFIPMLICIMLVSCRKQELFEFLYPIDEVSEISIVEITFENDGDMIQTEIAKIDDISVFMADFEKVDCYTYYGDPLGVTPEGINDTVIKITYQNGEYELINWTGQSEYTTESGLVYYRGYNIFDEKQFESLISRYQQTKTGDGSMSSSETTE